MVKINNLFIMTTPFHQKALYKLFDEKIQNHDTLVLTNELVDTTKISSKKEKLPTYVFSRRKLFKYPLKYWTHTKREILKVKNDINVLIKSYNFSENVNIIICSDKDIYTQILIEQLRVLCPQKKIIAVDEGLGFYMRLTLKDRIFSFVYKILTPILFNIRLYYIRRLGSHPEIDVIYVRALNLLPKGLLALDKYKTFRFNYDRNDSEIKTGKCLFFSFPDQDYGLHPSVKLNLVLHIARQTKANAKELVIKPHPREDIDFLKQQLESFENITFLDKRHPGEDICYFDYELIINFFSSIILDIIEKNYPKSNILTVGVWGKPRVSFDTELKYYNIRKFKKLTFFK